MQKKKLKRGDVVMLNKDRDNGFILYGRIWRRLDGGTVVVIDEGNHVTIASDDEVTAVDYKGRMRGLKFKVEMAGTSVKERWFPMTSLKRMKYYAAYYNPYFCHARGAWGHWTRQQRKIALSSLNRKEHWCGIEDFPCAIPYGE